MGGKGYASCGCDIITPCGCDIITSCGLRYHYILWLRGYGRMPYPPTQMSTHQHHTISTTQHLTTSTSQFTVMWKQPCLTSYLTRQRFCSRISRNTSESTHFSVSLRTCRRCGPSGSSTVW